MPRLAILNMLIGFGTLTLAASAGAFVATDLRDAFLYDHALRETWTHLVQSSAHGHTNLFAFLHIAFALTMPYSVWSRRIKSWQTIGLSMGTVAMGPLMIWRSYVLPKEGLDISGGVIAVFLTATLLALAAHAAGLAAKLMARS